MKKHKIILVDDEEQILKAMFRELKDDDREIKCFVSAEEALDYMFVERVDLIISDYHMPIIDGISFLTKAKKIQSDLMSILLSGEMDLSFLKDAINEAEIHRFISKPWNTFQLQKAVIQTLQFRDLQIENVNLANTVREQENHIQEQKLELERLEFSQPGITQLNYDEDGAIVIDEAGC